MGLYYSPQPPHIGAAQPLEPRKLTPPSAPTADNPPFRRRYAVEIYNSWIPGPPLPQLGALRIPPSGVLPDNPPFMRRFAAEIYNAWIPPQPLPLLPPLSTPPTGPGADNPPFMLRYPVEIANAWIAPPPQPYLVVVSPPPPPPPPPPPIVIPPGSGKRRDFPSYIPQPAYDEKPSKPFQPIWDRKRREELDRAQQRAVDRLAPPPLPPAGVFAPPPVPAAAPPSFANLVPPDPMGLAERMHAAATKSAEARDAAEAMSAIEDMSDAIAVLTKLGLLN